MNQKPLVYDQNLRALYNKVRPLYHAHYLYPDFILEMDCYLCHLLDDHLTLLEHLDYRWIEPQTSHDDIQWVPADRQVIEEIQKQGL